MRWYVNIMVKKTFVHFFTGAVLLFCLACGVVKKNETMDIAATQMVTRTGIESECDFSLHDLQVVMSDCTYWEAVKIVYDTASLCMGDSERVRSKVFMRGYRNRESTSVQQESREMTRQQEVSDIRDECIQIDRQAEWKRGGYGLYWHLVFIFSVIVLAVYLFKRFYK